MLRLPGLIDVHAHLREPGATHKEDWDSGTAAALAGGFTTILAMPNTQPPVTERATLQAALSLARAKARCDFGLFLGAGPELPDVDLAQLTVGLKMYLDQTFGPLRLRGLDSLSAHLSAWPEDRPVAVHAEGAGLAAAVLLASLQGRSVHLCHVSRGDEIRLIRRAKERGLQVTCEVTPHHLLLCDRDEPALGPGRCEVRPRLASPQDRQALWDNLDVIDCFATDHAPHTLAEKDGADPPPGFPGLETALPLLLTAVHQGRLTIEDLVARLFDNPRRIFGLPAPSGTCIEVDPDATWEISARELHSRCGWTPFEGQRVRGRVQQVMLRGEVVFRQGRVLGRPGTGRNVRQEGDLVSVVAKR